MGSQLYQRGGATLSGCVWEKDGLLWARQNTCFHRSVTQGAPQGGFKPPGWFPPPMVENSTHKGGALFRPPTRGRNRLYYSTPKIMALLGNNKGVHENISKNTGGETTTYIGGRKKQTIITVRRRKTPTQGI